MAHIKVRPFGRLSGGQDAFLYTLKNKNDVTVSITDFGAALQAVRLPQNDGRPRDVVLGFDSAGGYERTGLYLGATIGRYAGQIRGGSFWLDGRQYRLFKNDHENTLHGGKRGFDKHLFAAGLDEDNNKVTFHALIEDGEEGFPGNLEVESSYELTDNDEVIMIHRALSDKDTVLNMTNHSYYNLDGHDSGSIENHRLKIYSSQFLELSEDCCPNGNVLDVSGTPMDFLTMTRIGERIGQPYKQLDISEGYDHNWNIGGPAGTVRKVAELESSSNDVRMELYSDLPGLQFYSGNYLNGGETGKGGCRYGFRGGLCLEPQYYPAAPNYRQFPPAVLRRNETYEHTIRLKFSYTGG
ncbi:aldose 1-epimerase [Lachnospiraceae bacterium]|uniref:aldose epimerase family protein n=1 Tax=Extibacter sp. GGCC_0201 TaxID=2731209 RepID=UPI001AA10921|nr:aldose epimerase family protein [Extibacter sp. GGCC_0201]MBO1720308.1 galactose mutarotase [Extibacter sp. GGCC_0201]BDF32285.1 aldose 1-epimerase [Lachnospiraceae bacterium]BDF36295.1 aldose 1-epimerase [Lachnospiraceae bacterium]